MIVVPAAQLFRNYYFSLCLVRSVTSYLTQVLWEIRIFLFPNSSEHCGCDLL